MKKQNNKGFTLVELIVTITILAILATIAFLSYGYVVANSRNSKTSSQMSQLSKSIELGKTEGINIFSFIIPNIENTINEPYISGTKTSSNIYKAGEANLLALNYKEQDVNNKKYKIGATKKLNIRHEIAGYIEHETLGKLAKIIGNYRARTLSGTISEIASINSNKATLIKNNGIKKGDTITSSGSTIITTIVTNIKSGNNYNNIIYTSVNIPIGTTHLMLANDETKGLIKGKDKNSNTGVAIELGKYIP